MSKCFSIIILLTYSLFKNSFIVWVYNYIIYSYFSSLQPHPCCLSYSWSIYSLVVITCMYAYLYTFISPNMACSIYISLIICSFYFIILCFKWGSESTGKSKQNRQTNWHKNTEQGIKRRGWVWEELRLNVINYMKFMGICKKIILVNIKIKWVMHVSNLRQNIHNNPTSNSWERNTNKL